jgi:hypothetical protein
MRALVWMPMLLAHTAWAADSPNLYGAWRGQAQYQATIGSAHDPAAHAVVDLVIELDPRGKLTGISTANGCRLLGIASPGATPTMLHLDVTLSGCTYSGFNRRFSGQLLANTKQQFVSVSLQAHVIGKGGAQVFDVKATMRR